MATGDASAHPKRRWRNLAFYGVLLGLLSVAFNWLSYQGIADLASPGIQTALVGGVVVAIAAVTGIRIFATRALRRRRRSARP